MSNLFCSVMHAYTVDCTLLTAFRSDREKPAEKKGFCYLSAAFCGSLHAALHLMWCQICVSFFHDKAHQFQHCVHVHCSSKKIRKHLMILLKRPLFVSQMFHQGDILEIGRIERISSGN